MVSRRTHGLLSPANSCQIPKPNPQEGLKIGWPQQKVEMDDLKALAEDIKANM